MEDASHRHEERKTSFPAGLIHRSIATSFNHTGKKERAVTRKGGSQFFWERSYFLLFFVDFLSFFGFNQQDT